MQAPRFGLVRFRSPLLTQSRLISLPQGTEMFHFPWFGLAGLSLFTPRRHPTKDDGLPHSDTPGSRPVDGSPRFIAVFRVLLRLLMPRHPSCARIRLARFLSSLLSTSPISIYVAILLNLHTPSCQRSTPARTGERVHSISNPAQSRKGVFKFFFPKNTSPLFWPDFMALCQYMFACFLLVDVHPDEDAGFTEA